MAMTTLQLQPYHHMSLLPSSSSSSTSRGRTRVVKASLHAPISPSSSRRDIPTTMINMDSRTLIFTLDQQNNKATNQRLPAPAISDDDVISKLYAIAEAAADRASMHAIIGQQRNNWAHLLLTSTNSITLSASLMAGISAIPVAGSAHALAFELSSVLLFAAAAGVMSVTNKIQPSQLAEEQRNADRLFQRLEKSIHTTIAVGGAPTEADVEEAMEKVLALDKAYPLPLLPGMLDKFPETVEPTIWWPKQTKRRQRRSNAAANDDNHSNGWSEELEAEMRTILGVMKRNDEEEYVSTGEVVLKINRVLAVLGPLLAGVAGVGAGLVGTPGLGALPVLAGVVGGAAATAVNTLEHGGQLGMVFELLRNCAGFYREAEVEIASNLKERDVERRENGETFELKMALRLGRSLSDMKAFAAAAAASSSSSSSCQDHEFAGKLF